MRRTHRHVFPVKSFFFSFSLEQHGRVEREGGVRNEPPPPAFTGIMVGKKESLSVSASEARRQSRLGREGGHYIH